MTVEPTTRELPGDVRLIVDSPDGLPASVGSFLLRALGSAYPNTTIESGARTAFPGGLALRVPADDWLNAPGDTDLSDLTPVKDDPDMVVFCAGIADGAAQVRPPAWLAVFLAEVAEMIVDAADAPNYLQMSMSSPGGEPFSWIVCRPGRPSPHDLRRGAEARVAALEAQLRAAGIEPVAAPATE